MRFMMQLGVTLGQFYNPIKKVIWSYLEYLRSAEKLIDFFVFVKIVVASNVYMYSFLIFAQFI